MENRPKKKLLDVVRETIRRKHYSRRTEKSYVQWIKRYILFHKKRHPQEMGSAEIEAFLTHLAVKERVAASTQNPCTELVEVKPSVPYCSCTARCYTGNWNAPSRPSVPKGPSGCPPS